jgi:patatin-related protein
MHSDSSTRARGNATSPSASEPTLDVSQEVRFAVVMYGGVSLAIYINGVSQEILRLVQATAPDRRDGRTARRLEDTREEPRDTRWTYRKLAYLVADEALRADYRAQLTRNEPPLLPGQDVVTQRMIDGQELRTRFVVDILSGTSAGGINSMFLAKALANNRDMAALKTLWVNEGDMTLLLNDKDSLAGLELSLQSPPKSLLNSQRMYDRLLRALESMEEQSRSAATTESPCVGELDLFITATDIQGVPLPIRLSDKLVYERRHRNVFHFRYADARLLERPRNDFAADNNPFLAFAARCTSAFPFAFEPMCLEDIDDVLKTVPAYQDLAHGSASARWQDFFRNPLDPRTGERDAGVTRRAFGDGGYLDNKPFSYATEAMSRRHADLMVDRKLIYIEPNPEHPERVRKLAGKPNALANVKAATLDLPMYETIREDLQLLLQRNRLIQRVNRLISDIERDVEDYGRPHGQRAAFPEMTHGTWDDMDLAGMIHDYGTSYLPYRRLRIAAVTDELAAQVTRLTGFDEQSDYEIAIRCLVRAWRQRDYQERRRDPAQAGTAAPTINKFLTDFDLNYRLRRLTFLRSEIDELQKLVAASDNPDAVARDKALRELGQWLGLGSDPIRHEPPEADERPALAKMLAAFKREINELYMKLRRGERDIQRGASASQADGAANPDLAEELRALGLRPSHLEYILGVPWEQAREPGGQRLVVPERESGRDERAAELLDQPGTFELPADLVARLRKWADGLRVGLQSLMTPTTERLWDLLEEKKALTALEPPCDAVLRGLGKDDVGFRLLAPVRAYLLHYLQRFEHYDQIRFPLLYEAGIAEADVVEVIRISPEDAIRLKSTPKLAGTALRNFGAFLKKEWRQNDIMWGRLDGAERLISSLLPDPVDEPVRTALIEEAHVAILYEELPPEERTELDRLVARIRSGAAAGTPIDDILEQALQARRKQAGSSTEPEAAIPARPGRELLHYMRHDYKVDASLDPEDMLRLVSRSTQIVGKMFEDLATEHQLDRGSVVWVARIGQILWGLIEVASPRSIRHLLVRHWLKLLYVFEGFLIGSGWLLAEEDWIRFGGTALGITGGFHLVVLLLRDFMKRQARRWTRAAPLVLVVILLFFTGVGIDKIFELGIYEWFADFVRSIPGNLGELVGNPDPR